jgi:glycine/D-amino acid oxidase-like deaminating enzyme/nitrite reductase/ring-hydroxylating ferredoxin subunit
MAARPQGKHVSPWKDTMSPPEVGDTAFRQVAPDVVVVGAGVTGLTTAFLLQQAGRTVAVVEAARLGESVTVHSTVKVTVGHGTLYSKIAEKRGLQAAQAYADANVAGLHTILDLAQAHRIDCMLEHGHPHVVYAEHESEVEQVEKEAEVAAQLGLDVSLTRSVPLPFGVAQAVRFASQAHFHPGRYLAGLAEAFVAAGGALIEGARVTDVDSQGDRCQVQTTAGELSAGHVVIATQYPVLDRGGHFSQLKARRSYGVAGVLPDGVSAGMTINVGSPTHSTRSATLDGQELLIVVGEGHEVGHVTETAQRWTKLQDWARERFGVTDFRYHWSAEEVSSLDKVPFVGEIAPGSPRILTATAFDGWGMTNGTAAALMLRDLITGAENPWLATFDARRAETSLPPVKEFVKQNVHVAKTWFKDRVGGRPDGDPTGLGPGDAAILEVDGEQTAAYRDENGGLHAVSAVCTHMGCTVEWNGGEKSWDCPCHGSRFSHDGSVLHGPATTPLDKRDV